MISFCDQSLIYPGIGWDQNAYLSTEVFLIKVIIGITKGYTPNKWYFIHRRLYSVDKILKKGR